MSSASSSAEQAERGTSSPGQPYLLHQLLSASARLYPEREAASAAGRTLTYRELDSLSGRLASRLALLGVGRGDRVGIYVPKSLASLVSIFGVLKAGAAYVPLDPGAPGQRLSYIIADSGMSSVITNSERAGALASALGGDGSGPPAVMVDCDLPPDRKPGAPGGRAVSWAEVLETPPSLPPGGEPTENDMAYVLYTSGSTGSPKGVMLSHRNCLTFVNWAGDCVGLKKEDRVSSHAPIHFDLSTFDIFASVRAGSTIILVPEKASTFPVEIAKLIERERITVWYSVPSVLTLLVLYGNLQKHDLSSLRTVIFAGEVFPNKYLGGLMALLPGRRYLNWYGPTETNVCTWYEVSAPVQADGPPVPIGKPCSNTEVFSVGDDGKRVTEKGAEGELWVRGPSVMLGYWGDSEKTSRALVPNPFNGSYQERVYKTGDIVVMDGNGDYLYLGRKDGMVKTRGYRVELGEIEAVVYGYQGVKEAAVFPVRDELVGSLIRAAVVPLDPSGFEVEGLLRYCSQRLPKYMIPDKIELRAAIPRTSTGKTDRVALAREARGPES